MTDDEFDPTAREQREVGREMAVRGSGLGSVLAHTYRGELDRETTWRQRLDQTTTWAVTIVAAILTWAFSSANNPHYILLIGILTVAVFLGIEARRYRDYDVFRSRVRLLQENLLATALDPSQGVEHRDWRTELSEDFRTPTVKVPVLEAVSHRLRRVYLALLGVLLAAWTFRITAFVPQEDWLVTAGIGAVPGVAVIAAVGAFYAGVLVVAYWPRDRRAKGEFEEEEDSSAWKDSDDQ